MVIRVPSNIYNSINQTFLKEKRGQVKKNPLRVKAMENKKSQTATGKLPREEKQCPAN